MFYNISQIWIPYYLLGPGWYTKDSRRPCPPSPWASSASSYILALPDDLQPVGQTGPVDQSTMQIATSNHRPHSPCLPSWTKMYHINPYYGVCKKTSETIALVNKLWQIQLTILSVLIKPRDKNSSWQNGARVVKYTHILIFLDKETGLREDVRICAKSIMVVSSLIKSRTSILMNLDMKWICLTPKWLLIDFLSAQPRQKQLQLG